MDGDRLMKKTIAITALCLATFIIIIGICIGTSAKTLDFRGTITEIEMVDDTTVFYISMFETSYTVVANGKTNVSYCCKDDPDIDLSDIKVGDMIEGNYRRLSKNNMAKFITVEYHK